MHCGAWAPAEFFLGVSKLGSLDSRDGRKSPVESRGGAWWGSGGSPRGWRHVLKTMHKYLVYWGFQQLLFSFWSTKHFTTFSGGASAPPAWPCLRAPMLWREASTFIAGCLLHGVLTKQLACSVDCVIPCRSISYVHISERARVMGQNLERGDCLPQILSYCKILSTRLLALQCRKMCFLPSTAGLLW